MKRLLLPLLAALVLPTAVNAKPIYLSCEFNETRIFIGTQVNKSLNNWSPSFGKNPVDFTLNEISQSGSIFYKEQYDEQLNNITSKLAFVTFQPESMVISVVPTGNSFALEEKYTISRLDGSIFRKMLMAGGDSGGGIRREYKGICKKAEPKEKLF